MNCRRILIPLVAFVAMVLSTPVSLEASGSYRSRLPQPKARDVDRALYSLGQQIFDGKAALGGRQTADGGAQQARLEVLEQSLPKRVAKSKDLRSLSGRLSAQQLEALEYYVARRFGK